MKTVKLQNIYRAFVREENGVAIWIVDGALVRRDLYIDFIMGGHDGRYKFIPNKEIWIDNAISLEEFDYTVAHELLERQLMIEKGMNYEDAHDEAAALEHKKRNEDRVRAEQKERDTLPVERGTYFIYGTEGKQ